jgi:polyisoprenyl-teichoic acid--peptidoglycan teichoic acid transferase
MSKRKKIILSIALALSAIFIGFIGYSYYLFKSTIGTMHEPIARESVRPVDLQKKEPLSFLLLGIDARGTERGRTDTLLVITVNPNQKSMKMLSIPRDTRTEIVGKGFDDKINHAYAFGGPEMTIATVEKFLDIPIDHYITVNMEGFKDIIDSMGGVTVDNPFEFKHGGMTFPVGEQFLDGDAALAYSRMRYQDPRGDHGRNDRQRQIIDAVIKEGAQLSSVTNVQDILGAIGNNVRTDIDFDKMMKIQSNYKEARQTSEEISITGKGKMMNKVWYYIVDEEERLRVSSLLKEHLEIK